MTFEMDWKIAKWIHRHGKTIRSNTPKWFPKELGGAYRFFRVLQEPDENGYTVIGNNDEFIMLDTDLDAFTLERKRRIHAARDWIVPTTSVAAIVISIIALVVAIFSLLLQTQ